MTTFLYIQMGHGKGMLWRQLQFSLQIIFRLDCPTQHIFLVLRFGQLSKPWTLNESKDIICTDSLSCLQALHNMKLDHPLIGLVVRKYVFLSSANKDLVFFVGYLAMLVLGVRKMQT